MSEEQKQIDNLRWRGFADVADTIERLIRERDEALAKAYAASVAAGNERLEKAKAEVRGFERGVREAATAARQYKIIADQKFDGVLAQAQAGVKNLSLAGACAVGMLHMSEGIEAAILALLEKDKTNEPS